MNGNSKILSDCTPSSVEHITETTQSVIENAMRDELLTFLALTSSAASDESFFNKLARYLAQCLEMDFVCIDRLEGDGLTATTVAVWSDGHFEDNVSYALKDTPCGDVVGQAVCCFPSMVSNLFPNDQVLQDLNAESYVGVTLWSHTGKPIGLIAVISRQPLKNRPLAESIMQIVAIRAAGEIERLDAEKALFDSESKYRQLFYNQPNGYAFHEIILDSDGNPIDYRFLEINPAFEKMTGLKAVELVGKTRLEIMPNSEPYWTEIYGQVALTGKTITFENYSEVLNKHYQVTAYSPEPGRFATLFVDVTEQKRLEKELHDSLELFALFMKYSPVYTYIKQIEDNQSRVLQMSDNFIDMVGRPAEDLRGLTMFEIFPDDFARKMTEDDLNVVNSGNIIQLEEELNGRNYTTIKFPLFTESNKRFLAGFTIDITDRKRAEQEALELKQQFQQTQKLESLGVLAGGIAHDFNNILAIIMGNCSLAMMDGENAVKFILEIEKASERAAELCRQMLAYAGKGQFVQAKVNFESLVTEMVSMLKKTVPQNADIKLSCSTNIPSIQGDASQLSQIVMNLIINASEAIGKEQGEILVSLSEITINEGQIDRDYNGKVIPSGRYVCLEVTDNGCGMNEETKWRIFEPFYTTKFTGRGLGMSAVLGIIMSHNGALQLHSQLGQGTTFKVYLPSKENESAAKESFQQESQTLWRGSGTILLVEDEDQVRKIAKTFVEMFGFTVVEAVNGKEALDLYQKYAAEITLVLTDMGMPVMDGHALFHSLKQLRPELPIIISSGFGDAEVFTRIDHDDIAGLISKPYTPDKLREVLKRTLEGG